MIIDDFKDLVKERDNAIIYAWNDFDFSELEKYMKKYCGDTVLEKWKKSNATVKTLTLCTMTINVTSIELEPYKERAFELYKEITGKEYGCIK